MPPYEESMQMGGDAMEDDAEESGNVGGGSASALTAVASLLPAEYGGPTAASAAHMLEDWQRWWRLLQTGIPTCVV